jgi:hypothetical protein
MKVKVTVEKNDQNIMEFDCADSGLTEEELVRNILAVAQEWVKRYEDNH